MLQYSYRPNFPPTRQTRRDADQVWLHAPGDRPKIVWPDDARIAVWICVAVLDYEYMPPADQWVNAWARTAPPDVLGYSRQDYGNRVGFWRVLDQFAKHAIRPTAVINTDALHRWPSIARVMAEGHWDVLGHGISNTRFIYGSKPEEELASYREMIATVDALTGLRMAGMGGPGPQAGTEDTPDLMAEAGFVYSSDWSCDDVPVPLHVRKGRLIAMPYPIEMNDVSALATSEADAFADAACRQFDRLYAEGGGVFSLSLHPALIGQPQRIAYLDRIFAHVRRHTNVWHATGAEIAEFYDRTYNDSAISGPEKT
jgi:allantoinase